MGPKGESSEYLLFWCPQKRYKMLPEPWCAGWINNSQNSLRLKLCLWSFLFKTMEDQAIPSHCNGHWHAVFALYTGRVGIHAVLCDNCNNISTMFNDWLSGSLTQTTKLSRSDRIIGSSFEIRAGRELKTDSRFSASKHRESDSQWGSFSPSDQERAPSYEGGY